MFVSYRTIVGVVCLVALVAALAVYGVKNSSAILWRIGSRRYKAKVLAEPASANGEFRHIEWDGWGWAGQDTTEYLVFDPTDALSVAAEKPTTRQVRRDTLRNLSCASAGEPLVHGAVLHQ